MNRRHWLTLALAGFAGWLTGRPALPPGPAPAPGPDGQASLFGAEDMLLVVETGGVCLAARVRGECEVTGVLDGRAVRGTLTLRNVITSNDVASRIFAGLGDVMNAAGNRLRFWVAGQDWLVEAAVATDIGPSVRDGDVTLTEFLTVVFAGAAIDGHRPTRKDWLREAGERQFGRGPLAACAALPTRVG